MREPIQAKLDRIQMQVADITGPEPTAEDWTIIWSTLDDPVEMARQLRAAHAPHKVGKLIMFPNAPLSHA